MEMKSFRLPQHAWYGDAFVEISLPADWEIRVAEIPADRLAVLTTAVLRQKMDCPIASPSLRELALGKNKAVIIFDDLSRPTRLDELAPMVVEQLLAGGISAEKISFIAALGAHGAHTRLDFEKKLGNYIVSRFPVYNHNPYENCTHIGETRYGTPLYINREVLAADLKIGMGCILPHAFNGFGGGGKIILPGVSGMATIQANHTRVVHDLKERGVDFVGNMGLTENSKMKEEIADALNAVKLDFLINVLPNSNRKAVGIVAGAPDPAYADGVAQAQQLYLTQYHGDADVVVANANAKANEALIALLLGARSLKKRGGDLITVVNCPAGQIVHYLFGQFGEEHGGRLWSGGGNFPPAINRSIIYSSCGGQRFGLHQAAQEYADWQQVLQLLREKNGPGTKAVVYRDATMQWCAAPAVS